MKILFTIWKRNINFITVPTIEDEYGNPGLDRKIGDYYRPCVELFTDLEVPERTHEFGLYYWEDYSYCDEYFEKDIQDFGPLLPSITGIDADYVLIYVSGLRYETEISANQRPFWPFFNRS